MKQSDTFWQQSSVFPSNCQHQTVTWCRTITNTIYCCVHFLIMFQYWGWRICWLDFEISFDQREQMFPFHTLVFALWIVVVDPDFVPSDVSQISVTSATVTLLSFRIIALNVLIDGGYRQLAWSYCIITFVQLLFILSTNCSNTASVKHCTHTVLQVFDGLLTLVHLKTTKIRSLHTALLWHIKQVEWSYRPGYNNTTSDHPRSKRQKSWPRVSTQLAALPTKQKYKQNIADTFWLTHILLH